MTVYPILFSLSLSHLLNDTLQSIIPAIYPIVKDNLNLSFTQIGIITLVFQMSASIMQPFVGLYTDKRPQPFSLAIGMTCTLAGLVFLSFSTHYGTLLFSVGLAGLGSAVFHPEASRMAYVAAGGRRGLAQSIFQLGGNAGSSFGPLLAALIIAPQGQLSILWFTILAMIAIAILRKVGIWYKAHLTIAKKTNKPIYTAPDNGLPRSKVSLSVFILIILIFSKYFYLASMTSYFTFYLIDKFGVSVQNSQIYLFLFLFAVAAGTLIGGPIGDRFGRKYVIWISILGVAPFSLALPYVNLFWTTALIFPIGFILASAFSAILVYAQELIPGKVGLVAGLFFGLAFGMGGIGSALLGILADHTSISYVYKVCAYLPLLGILAWFLPNVGSARQKTR
ncbi:MAG: MFS transporter [Chitinophagaceae bacterium]|nr:MFS transporter [Chitinophagaceae bacterium]